MPTPDGQETFTIRNGQELSRMQNQAVSATHSICEILVLIDKPYPCIGEVFIINR
jgi:hypothetical protein